MKTSSELFIEMREREVLEELHQDRINAHALTEYKRDIDHNVEIDTMIEREIESTPFENEIFEREEGGRS